MGLLHLVTFGYNLLHIVLFHDYITQPCHDINFSDYKIHGTQNDWHEPSVSTQKLVWKNMHRVQKYREKGEHILTFSFKS